MEKSRNLISLASALAIGLTIIAMATSASATGDDSDGHKHAAVVVADDFPVVTRVISDRTGDIPEPPSGKISVRLSIAYAPDRLPGDGLTFHEPDPEVNSLWAMESLEKGEEVPSHAQIENGVLFLEPGESRMVTVVYKNPTDASVKFVTLPHQDSPGYIAHFAKLTCFCLSFVYEAPPGGAWYRVIRVGVNELTPPGSKIDSMFTILTDESNFAPAGS